MFTFEVLAMRSATKLRVMKLETLKKRLTKLGVQFEINQEYQEIEFQLNGTTCYGSIHGETTPSFHYNTGYDEANQETRRCYFDTFKHLVNRLTNK